MNNRAENGTTRHPAFNQDEVHLRDYLKTLRRRWKTVLVSFLLVSLSILVYSFFSKPVYQAETLLQVSESTRGTAIFGELANLSDGASDVETEMEVLRSRSLAAEVVKALEMDITLSDISDGILSRFVASREGGITGPRIFSLVVPPGLLGERMDLTFDGSGQNFSLRRGSETLLNGTPGIPATSGELALLIEQGSFLPHSRYTLSRQDMRVAAAQLLENLEVEQVGRNTGVVRIAYRSTDPNQAATVLETLNRLYINRDVRETSRDAVATLDFITSQVEGVKDGLGKSQSLLDDYKVRTGAVALSQEAELLVGRISDLEVEINRLRVQKSGLEALLQSIGKESATLAAGMSALGIDSPELASLVTDYSQMVRRRGEILREFTPENPVVVALDSQIDLASSQIAATATEIRNGIVRREDAVKGVLDNYRRQLTRLPEVERNLAKLQGDVLIQEKIYSFLLEKEQETRILKASNVSGIRIVDPPTVPIKPITPRKTRNTVLGIILGLMVGAGLAFFFEYLDDSVKDSEDLEKKIGVPVYGAIPFVKKAFERRRKKQPHLVIEEMHAPVTEAFRTLRTNLFFSKEGSHLKTVAVTSPEPGAGKSFVVANLAALSALMGKRTLVIDADMRNPQQHVVLGVSQGPGLSEVLAGQATLDEAIQKDHVKELKIITSGSIPPNPAELLGSDEMKVLLKEAGERFDMVIIDTPPVSLVADPLHLARMCQFTLVVARSSKTTHRQVEWATSQLRNIQVDGIGMVVNAIRHTEMGYSEHYYRYVER